MTSRRAAERADLVLRLRAERRSFADIGAQLGVSKQRAYQLHQAALRQVPATTLAQVRQEEGELIDEAVRELRVIALDPDTSPRTKVEAWGQIRGYSESRRRLYGADAPRREEIQIISEATIDAEIERKTAELLAHGVTDEQIAEWLGGADGER